MTMAEKALPAFREGGEAGEESKCHRAETWNRVSLPGIPAEESDRQRRGHLHVQWNGAREEADDAGARLAGDQGPHPTWAARGRKRRMWR